jgi:hypothetical protein
MHDIGATGVGLIFAEWNSQTETDIVTELLRVSDERATRIPIILIIPRGWNRILELASDLGAYDVLLAPPNPAEIKAEIERVTTDPWLVAR